MGVQAWIALNTHIFSGVSSAGPAMLAWWRKMSSLEDLANRHAGELEFRESGTHCVAGGSVEIKGRRKRSGRRDGWQ